MTEGAASKPDSILQEKAALRKATLARRDALDAAIRARNSQTITQCILALPAYTEAKVVAAYASFGSEYDTSTFLACILADGKQLLLPRMDRASHTLELREVTDLEKDLVAGVWGIREPAPSRPVRSLATIDFLLVPGVAFTAAGARLGYGGGYYDRLMGSLDARVPRIAAAFDLQMVSALPESSHDQRVQAVITEK
jgi:5-formyltetrahydrofolate cyclo-ligase